MILFGKNHFEQGVLDLSKCFVSFLKIERLLNSLCDINIF